MKIIRNSEPAGPRVIALGTFDGVHLGHRELIRRGKELALEEGVPLRVYTFDRHPLEILRPEAAPGRLQTPEEQAERMAEYGVDELRVLAFTRETAETEPGDFLRGLREECRLRAVTAGWNYTFGRGGRGTAELLREDAEAHGYRAVIVPAVRTREGEIISSSAVREKLRRGDVGGAEEMLGFPYRISGTVVSGKHQGTRIGFPTANIRTGENKLLPAWGVYACELESEGQRWNAVVNIGCQPTIPSGQMTVEAHALGAEVDLYGKRAAVVLRKFLRPERRFSSVGELTAQIARDRTAAEEYLRT